jgi:hypothetical protein
MAVKAQVDAVVKTIRSTVTTGMPYSVRKSNKFPNTLESLDDTEYPQRDNINNRTHD